MASQYTPVKRLAGEMAIKTWKFGIYIYEAKINSKHPKYIHRSMNGQVQGWDWRDGGRKILNLETSHLTSVLTGPRLILSLAVEIRPCLG